MGLDPRTLLRSTPGQLLLAMAAVITAAAFVEVWQSQRWDLRARQAQEAERLRGIAAATAAHIDGDLHERTAAAHPDRDAFTSWSAAPAGAQALHAQLATVAGHAALGSPVYTLRLREEAREAVAAQPDRPHPDAMAFIGTSAAAPYWRHTYPYKPAMRAALFGGTPATTALYADDHGEWMSAYAPVTDARGRVVALLEVDAPFTPLKAAHDARLARQVVLLAAAGAAGFILLAVLARRLAQASALIEAAAGRIGAGDLQTRTDPAAFPEMAPVVDAMERARVALSARAHDADAAARALRHQRALALRGIDDAAIQRRGAFRELSGSLETATRVGDGRPQRVLLADLSYGEAAVIAGVELDLAPGTPLRLRIACTATGQRVALPARVVGRTPLGDKGAEYRLRLVVDAALVPFPAPVAAAMDGRRADRVGPGGPRPASVALRVGGRRVQAELVDISSTGIGLRVALPVETVSRWGTRLQVELSLPGTDAAIPFTAELARIVDAAGRGPLLGLRLIAGDEGGFARRQQLVAAHVEAQRRAALPPAAAAG